MAVPVPQNYYTGDTGGATATFVQLVRPGPGITPTGDFLMMIVGSDANNSPDWLPYAGRNLEVNINAAVSDCNLAIYWRIADGTEPGAENPAGTGSLERWGYYFYITGVDSTSPIHLVGAANRG